VSPTAFQIITMLAALASAACTFFVAWRAGRWRETEEAKALLKRMGEAENRISACEIRMEDLPTQADIARLESEIKGVGTQVGAANAGIDRLEGYFLQRGVQNVG
jgi:hypothetical protein